MGLVAVIKTLNRDIPFSSYAFPKVFSPVFRPHFIVVGFSHWVTENRSALLKRDSVFS